MGISLIALKIVFLIMCLIALLILIFTIGYFVVVRQLYKDEIIKEFYEKNGRKPNRNELANFNN